jgi:hypothetical protein
MYTGTLINDLMATVERVEARTQQRRETVEEMELRMLEAMYAQPAQNQPAFAGAA